MVYLLAIGSALLNAVIERARGEYPNIRLSYLEGNTSAQGFYSSRGFVEVGRESSGDGIPESICMELVLDPGEQA